VSDIFQTRLKRDEKVATFKTAVAIGQYNAKQ
jgi:hypothetical protein